jgi:hypothetical protein
MNEESPSDADAIQSQIRALDGIIASGGLNPDEPMNNTSMYINVGDSASSPNGWNSQQILDWYTRAGVTFTTSAASSVYTVFADPINDPNDIEIPSRFDFFGNCKLVK